MSMEINGKVFDTDEEGYLANLSDWSPEVAAHMAEQDECDLSDNQLVSPDRPDASRPSGLQPTPVNFRPVTSRHVIPYSDLCGGVLCGRRNARRGAGL